jgi:uncharacterized RDD family membrane protein YckC
MEPVGVGLRAVATIIDTALLFVIGYIIAMFTGGTSRGGFELSGIPAFIWLVIAIGYYTVMEAQSGATIGKRLVGLRWSSSMPLHPSICRLRLCATCCE